MTVNPTVLTQKIEAAIDRALAINTPGDEVVMELVGTCTWFTGDNQGKNVTLLVPTGDDLHAGLLNVYLSARKFDQSDPLGTGTDLTYRPAMWVTTQNSRDLTSQFFAQDANATWKMTDTYNGTYQGESGLSIGAAYSSRYGQGPVVQEKNLCAWPGARKFYMPRRIRRGTAITVAIQPTFGRTQNTTIKTQFRATVVITGHKIVRGVG